MSYSSDSQNQSPYSYQPPPRRVRRPVSLPYITYFMIGSCVLVYIGQMLTQNSMGGDLLSLYGAKINAAILNGQFWRLITPMWLHGSILHIMFNMYALAIFGSNLERFYGHGRFLLLYLLSGFAGNVVSFMMTPRTSLGSSTAIFGLLAAQGVFIYQNRSLIRNSRSLLINTIAIAAINLFFGLSPGIDNWGHLGGLIGGLAFAWSAGPIWEENALFGVRAVRRDTGRVILTAVGVVIVFSALVVLKIATS
jgi:rhomboid protease GluP